MIWFGSIKFMFDLFWWTESSDESKIKGKGKGKVGNVGVVTWKPPVYPAHLRRY